MKVEPTWMEAVEETTRRLEYFVPSDGSIATADRWDPTILMLASRTSNRLAIRALFQDGYPADSAEALRLLDRVVAEGTSHLVLPRFAYWWLDHYPRLKHELEARWIELCRDEYCSIYRSPGAGRSGMPA